MESDKAKLFLIVPVTRLSGKEKNLRNWILKLSSPEVSVLLAHDVQDSSTARILQSILAEARNSRIHLIDSTLNSPGLTRNLGIGYLQSDWTWFVDADDLPEISDALTIIEMANKDSEVLIANYSLMFIDSKQKNKTLINSQTLESVAMNPGLWRMIFRTDQINEHKFKKYRMGEDQLFLMDFGIFHRRVQFFQTSIYTYFKNVHGQLTSRKKDILEITDVISETVTIFKDANESEKKLIGVVLLRQLLTLIKNSNLTEVYHLMNQGVKKISVFKINELSILLGSFLIICKSQLVNYD